MELMWGKPALTLQLKVDPDRANPLQCKKNLDQSRRGSYDSQQEVVLATTPTRGTMTHAPTSRHRTENKEFKRIAKRISLILSKISEIRANELFRIKPFAILEIDRGRVEKFVRFDLSRLLNWGGHR
jgi:hypothetical protein